MLETLRNAIWNILEANWHTCSYHGTKVKLPFNPRKGTCECCGRRGQTNRHHWRYAYTRKQILKQNMLVLNFTSELCFNPCHELGNSIRKILSESPNLKFKNPSPTMKKLLELREKALADGEKYEKLSKSNQ